MPIVQNIHKQKSCKKDFVNGCLHSTEHVIDDADIKYKHEISDVTKYDKAVWNILG